MRLILWLALLTCFWITGSAVAEKKMQLLPMPELGEEGLYKESWFETTFLDLRQDLKDANARGRRLVIIWEQRGCPYCKATHEVNLRIPKIVDYLRENFSVLQLNLWGSIEVTDFDGKILSEKDLARKYGILFTPTIQFFPQEAEKKPGQKVELMRVPGYFKPFEFYFLFRYIKENAYVVEPSFQTWLNAHGAKLRMKGVDVERALWADSLELAE